MHMAVQLEDMGNTMSAASDAFFLSSLEQARQNERDGLAETAWENLVRAHIVGQRSTRLHVSSHVAMLGLAWRTSNWREVPGQVFRIAGAALVTWIWVPTGNTGRANVSAFKPMPVPADLSHLTD